MKRKFCWFTLVSVIFFIFAIYFGFFKLKIKFYDYIKKYSTENEIDVALVLAIVKVESNFDESAVSRVGAVGLMQIMPSTAGWICEKQGNKYFENDLFNPEQNIKIGCLYLRYLFKKFKDIDVVICAYNAGESKVLDWVENGKLIENKINYTETNNYLKKVKKYYRWYEYKLQGLKIACIS